MAVPTDRISLLLLGATSGQRSAKGFLDLRLRVRRGPRWTEIATLRRASTRHCRAAGARTRMFVLQPESQLLKCPQFAERGVVPIKTAPASCAFPLPNAERSHPAVHGHPRQPGPLWQLIFHDLLLR